MNDAVQDLSLSVKDVMEATMRVRAPSMRTVNGTFWNEDVLEGDNMNMVLMIISV